MKKLFVLPMIILILTGFTSVLKTSVTLTVRDEVGNVVEGASVRFFSNKEDYEKELKPIATATTDAKGVAKFKEINNLNIFILVRKGDKDNSGGGEQTKLEKGKINKVTVVIQ